MRPWKIVRHRIIHSTLAGGLPRTAGTSLANAIGSNTSTFVGTFGADYTDTLLRDPEVMPVYQTTNSGHSRAIISNRLAYFFDFKGTSVTGALF